MRNRNNFPALCTKTLQNTRHKIFSNSVWSVIHDSSNFYYAVWTECGGVIANFESFHLISPLEKENGLRRALFISNKFFCKFNPPSLISFFQKWLGDTQHSHCILVIYKPFSMRPPQVCTSKMFCKSRYC